MRPSPFRHPVAVLRHILGLGQPEFGQLCKRSGRTIQSVELGHLQLSEGLALALSEATGVSVGWLLDGDPSAPPIADSKFGAVEPGSPYTLESYEAHRAMADIEERAAAGLGRELTHDQLITAVEAAKARGQQDEKLVERCSEVLALTQESERAEVVRWRLKRCLDELAEAHYAASPAKSGGSRSLASKSTRVTASRD